MAFFLKYLKNIGQKKIKPRKSTVHEKRVQLITHLTDEQKLFSRFHRTKPVP
jgi:hypothetical protein